LFHELIVRIAGLHITSLIYFLLPHAEYTNNQLMLSMHLTNPATQDIIGIVESGFIFRIKLYGSITVNNNRVYRFERIKSFAMKESACFVNDTLVDSIDVQKRLGECSAVFSGLNFKEGDRLLVYFSASILPDQDFEKSTGLTTAILWNYYIPHIKAHGIIQGGRPILQE
jgi:hypothetical protein